MESAAPATSSSNYSSAAAHLSLLPLSQLECGETALTWCKHEVACTDEIWCLSKSGEGTVEGFVSVTRSFRGKLIEARALVDGVEFEGEEALDLFEIADSRLKRAYRARLSSLVVRDNGARTSRPQTGAVLSPS